MNVLCDGYVTMVTTTINAVRDTYLCGSIEWKLCVVLKFLCIGKCPTLNRVVWRRTVLPQTSPDPLFCAKCSHTNALWWHLVYDCMIVWLSRTSIATQERLHDPAGKPTVYHSRAQSERQIFRAARKGGGGGRDKLETYPVRTARPCLPCTESPCEACVSCTWS